jgi:hypothetical protein
MNIVFGRKYHYEDGLRYEEVKLTPKNVNNYYGFHLQTSFSSSSSNKVSVHLNLSISKRVRTHSIGDVIFTYTVKVFYKNASNPNEYDYDIETVEFSENISYGNEDISLNYRYEISTSFDRIDFSMEPCTLKNISGTIHFLSL